MSVLLLKLGIIAFSVSTLQTGGEQNPAEALKVGKTRSADKVEILYVSQGSGDTAVIFIHGGFADRSFWKNQMKPFAAKYRVIALDLAGHGESGKNREKWNLTNFAEDVRAVMVKEKIQRAVLVGNSLGGPVALETARLVPDKVLGIVGVDTFQDVTVMPPPEHFRQQARAFRSDFTGSIKETVSSVFHKDADPELRAQVEKRMLKGSARVAAELMESFADYDLTGAAKKLTHPLRCINGDLYPTRVEKNRGVLPDFDAVILPKTGHFPMLEQPELFNSHLEKILLQFTAAKK